MFCTRLANRDLFPTVDPIVPFVIDPRFECAYLLTGTYKLLENIVEQFSALIVVSVLSVWLYYACTKSGKGQR